MPSENFLTSNQTGKKTFLFKPAILRTTAQGFLYLYRARKSIDL